MRSGIVTKWFNRGQPVVARQTRSALDELGHETFVLARPKKERGPQKGALSREGVWDQPGVTEAKSYEITLDEYLGWVEANGIEAVWCDQNYQFEELRTLRERGVLTIGRFVWEHFAPEHVEGALSAFDVIYSLTKCEQERYGSMGVSSPYVPWGIHPEILQAARAARPDPSDSRPGGCVKVIFPGGFIGHRKPLGPILEAFSKTRNPDLRLLVKAQVERKTLADARDAAEADPRLTLLLADQSMEEHYATFGEYDVCLVPSRWEGLGLPHYEAMAFGMPVITNDDPPMNEIVEHERNGLLVPSHQIGTAQSGIPAMDPDVDALAEAIERIADDELRARLSAGAREVCEERAWKHTVAGLGELVEQAQAARAGTRS